MNPTHGRQRHPSHPPKHRWLKKHPCLINDYDLRFALAPAAVSIQPRMLVLFFLPLPSPHAFKKRRDWKFVPLTLEDKIFVPRNTFLARNPQTVMLAVREREERSHLLPPLSPASHQLFSMKEEGRGRGEEEERLTV